MSPSRPCSTVAQPFQSVNRDDTGSTIPPPGSMMHHKGSLPDRLVIRSLDSMGTRKPYGVSPDERVLSPSLILKKWDYIRDCLEVVLGLSPGQVEITMRLLRLWAYYGYVYPKESQVTRGTDETPLPQTMDQWQAASMGPRPRGCSKATFWRTVKILRDLGLVHVINRYLVRPHAQISNLYRLDKLIILIASYLAERIAHVWPRWLTPWLRLSWPEIWQSLCPNPSAPGDG